MPDVDHHASDKCFYMPLKCI